MKVFLDANILISVLNKEYPLFTYSARVLSLTDNSKFHLYTSPLCLAIAFYFSEKKNGKAETRRKIKILIEKLRFTTISEKMVFEVEKNKKIHDFEDGLQYYSAIDSGCKYIITEDQSDFYFSEIEVMPSRQFLEKYVF
ncbi:MAG: PIN domain-containing protein [Bacteroidota bacterium]|nr:PIN domain-containing protein [Bacteroidota bacterium]